MGVMGFVEGLGTEVGGIAAVKCTCDALVSWPGLMETRMRLRTYQPTDTNREPCTLVSCRGVVSCKPTSNDLHLLSPPKPSTLAQLLHQRNISHATYIMLPLIVR